MCVIWNGNTGCLGTLKEEKQKLSRLSCLSHLPGPIITKETSCLAASFREDCNQRVWSTGSRVQAARIPPLLDGWCWWRVDTRILPEYEQQICQCVTGWQPSSQLLVHCCYISTLSECSAKRQSASSIYRRQVALKKKKGKEGKPSSDFRLYWCQNTLKRDNLNISVCL